MLMLAMTSVAKAKDPDTESDVVPAITNLEEIDANRVQRDRKKKELPDEPGAGEPPPKNLKKEDRDLVERGVEKLFGDQIGRILVSPINPVAPAPEEEEPDTASVPNTASYTWAASAARHCAANLSEECDLESALQALERAKAFELTKGETEEHRGEPINPEPFLLHAQLLLSEGRGNAQKALDVLDLLRSHGYDTREIAFYRGVAFLGVQDWWPAKTSFEAAVSDRKWCRDEHGPIGSSDDAARLEAGARLPRRDRAMAHLLAGVANSELAHDAYRLESKGDEPATTRAHSETPKERPPRLPSGVSPIEHYADLAGCHFKRARSLDPDLRDHSTYRRGWLAYGLEHYTDAQEHAIRVLGSGLDHAAATLVAQAKKKERKARRWDGFATIGGGYDSNVTLTSENALTTSRRAGLGSLKLGGRYRLYDHKRLELDFLQTGFANFHTKLTDFGLQISSSTLRSRSNLGRGFVVKLDYTFEYAAVDWDGYRHAHSFRPSLVYNIGKGHWTRTWFRFQELDYRDAVGLPSDELDRDRSIYSTGFDFYPRVKWLEQWGPAWMRFGYQFRHTGADNDEFDSEAHEPVITLGVYLPALFFVTVEGRYQWRDYDTPSRFEQDDDSDHSDEIATFSASLERAITRQFSGKIRYRYTDRDSNVDLYEYNRNQVEVLFTYNFGSTANGPATGTEKSQ